MDTDQVKVRKFAGMKVPPDLGRRHFLFLFIGTFILGMFMAIPPVVQPVLLGETLGVAPDFLGTTNALFQQLSQVAMLLLAALVGAWSDRVGRKRLAWIGFLIIAVSIFLFGKSAEVAAALGISGEGAATLCAYLSYVPSKAEQFVPFAPGLAVAYFFRLMLGVGLAFTFPQFLSWVADYTYPDDRGKGMGFNGLMLGGSSLIVFVVFSVIQKSAGPAVVFTLSAIFALVGFLLTLLFLKNRQPDTPPEAKKSFGQIMGIVKKRLPLKASYLVALITRSDTPLIPALLPMWAVKVASDHGMTAAEANQKIFMVALPILGILSIVSFPLAGILLDKLGRIKVIILSLLLIAASYVLLVVAPSPFAFWAIVPAMVLAGCGMAGTVAGANTWVTDGAPKEDVGAVLGGLNTMTAISVLLFLGICGYLFDAFGPGVAFAVKGGADLLLAIWILTIRGRVERESSQNPANSTENPATP
jgi:MFS family permease